MRLCVWSCFFFFKQKTAYEMRISDWSSDVCSSDLAADGGYGRDLRTFGYAGRIESFEPLAAAYARLEKNLDANWPAHHHALGEIGRASCRERGCQSGERSVVAGSLKKKTDEDNQVEEED